MTQSDDAITKEQTGLLCDDVHTSQILKCHQQKANTDSVARPSLPQPLDEVQRAMFYAGRRHTDLDLLSDLA